MFPVLQNARIVHSRMPNIAASILDNERIFPKDVCGIIGMYSVVTDDDRIMFMLANRESPEIFLYDTAVVDDLDEMMTIKYAREDDQWASMSVLDRLASLADRVFTVAIKVGDLRGDAQYTLKRLVGHMCECGEVISDPDKKTDPRNIFACWIPMGSRTVFRLSSDWMLL